MSPQMTMGGTAAGFGGRQMPTAQASQAAFAQFKRRQGSTLAHMAV